MIGALRKFIISQGPSKNINNLEWASFWAENKKVIDPIALRLTCIAKERRQMLLNYFLTVKGPREPFWRPMPEGISIKTHPIP